DAVLHTFGQLLGALGLGLDPGFRLGNQALHEDGQQHRDDGDVEQVAPAVGRQQPAGEQGGNDVAHGPAGLQGAQYGGAVLGRYVLGHQGVTGHVQCAQAQGGDEAEQRKLPVALGQAQNGGADREQDDGPDHGLDATEAVAAPAAVDAANGHARQGEATQCAGFDVGQVEFGLQAGQAVGE